MPNASLPGSAGPFGGSLNRWVARSCPAAVNALAIEISTPVSRAPGSRCRREDVAAVVADADGLLDAELLGLGPGRLRASAARRRG